MNKTKRERYREEHIASVLSFICSQIASSQTIEDNRAYELSIKFKVDDFCLKTLESPVLIDIEDDSESVFYNG